MSSHQWSRRLFLSILTLAVICVHLSDGSSISREIKSERSPREKSSDNDIKPQKKTQFQKKYKQPSIPIDRKKSPKNKLKISDLRPCISKAFCEVNSITEEPTYETSQEFYMILNRLKKFIDDGEKSDLNGSGSDEDDYSGSSEESYERVPYMRNNDNGPHRSGSPPYYRRGKSLAEIEAKLKKKKIKKLAKLDTKSKNGTQTIELELPVKNSTKPLKVYSPAQIEQRAFIDRKTQELNVVDDLAALIKISAEIGQALKSPRRCRSLFKKCRMTYEQIIRIFNRTQSVETSDQDTGAVTTPEPFLVVETLPTLSTDSSLLPSVVSTPTKEGDQEDVENVSDGDGNRNKKSRTDFSDDEDPEYATDSEAEVQPVKTYSLFSTSQAASPGDGTGSKRQEAIVDEAFHKFEKVFPSSGTAEKTKLYQNQKGSISSKLRPVVASSSEEEESSESGEIRRPSASVQSDYNHRSSAEDNPPDSEEVEMEVPDKKIKTKHNTRPVKENFEIAGEVDEAEDDSDAEIASSEIGKKPEDEETDTVKVPKKSKPGTESSSEEEASIEEDLNRVKDQPIGDLIYTRDDDKSGGFNSYGFYPQVRPTFSQHPTKSVKSKGKRRKGNKKGQKEEKPQNDQNSSEEDPRNPDHMPPPNSDFYQVLKQVDDGKGASVIPGKGPRGKKSKSKRRPGHEPEPEQYGDYQDYGSSSVRRPGYGSSGGRPSGYTGGYGSSMEKPGYGSEEGPPQSDDQQQQPSGGGGFFQSIMGWFSRGKSAQVNNEQTGPGQYSGGFFGGGWGNENKRPSRPEDDDGPSYNRYHKYSGEYDSDAYNGPSSSGTRRKPEKYSGDHDSSRYPSSQEDPPRRDRRPPPRGRGGDSSEEEEEEDEEQVRPVKRQIPKRRQTSQGNSNQQAQYLGPSSGLSVSGPPPPLVIEPTGEDALEYASQRDPTSSNKPQQKQPTKQKPSPPPVENSEESKEETSSEEKVTAKQSPSSKKQSNKKTAGKQAEGEKVFSGMFASAAEIDKQIIRDKEQDDDRDDAGLLLSTFDSVANSFSTSADKIRDWSKEDNSRKKINVGLFATNTRGKYTVKRNRNKNTGQEGGEGEADVGDKYEKGSSEEEEEKR